MPNSANGEEVRDYLRFLRLDSASASVAYVLLGYTLAGGPILSLTSVSWALFGLLFHAAGYADNNLQDLSYDLNDPNKQLFPLGRSLSVPRARILTVGLHAAGLLSAALFSRSLVTFAAFLPFYVAGLLYNRTSKVWKGAPFLFALTFSPLSVFAFYSTSGTVSGSIIAICALAFLECLFQNAVSTSVKDVESDLVNPMKSLGVRVVGGSLSVPALVFSIGLGLKLLGLGPITYLFVTHNLLVLSVSAPVLIVSFLGTVKMLQGGRWGRSRFMLLAAVSEIGVYYAVIGVFAFDLGVFWAAFMGGFPIVWYVFVKKAIWGTVLGLRA